MRDGEVRVRNSSSTILDPPLVLRVEVRVEQADGDRLDAGLAQSAHLLAHLVLVERHQDVAVRRGHALFWTVSR